MSNPSMQEAKAEGPQNRRLQNKPLTQIKENRLTSKKKNIQSSGLLRTTGRCEFYLLQLIPAKMKHLSCLTCLPPATHHSVWNFGSHDRWSSSASLNEVNLCCLQRSSFRLLPNDFHPFLIFHIA